MPTQIGRTFCPSESRSRMIGMLVTGSTISPLIVISICMALWLTLGLDTSGVKLKCFSGEAIRAGARNPHRHCAPQPLAGTREIDDGIAERAPGEFPVAPPADRINQHVDP